MSLFGIFNFRTLVNVQLGYRSIMSQLSHSLSSVVNKMDDVKDFHTLKSSKKVVERTWDETMITLNSFQSNYATIKEALKTNIRKKIQKRDMVINHLNTLGVNMNQLNKLNVIHVSGTKGKGSTCAYVESILRHQGYTTGLYTSPHLISCRERIRINGKMISEQEFKTNFWQVYEKVCSQTEIENKPGYFMFLTILAFYIFVKLNVNVMILEVGIGGEYDCTNIISKPRVVGISSLGLDHVKVLGSHIESIAWNKAGIIKPHSLCFTVEQKLEAFNVIKSRAEEKNSKLFVCPSIDKYKLPSNRKLVFGINGDVQAINASLAIQLSKAWVKQMKQVCSENSSKDINDINDYQMDDEENLKLTDQELDGLECAVLNGRCQLIKTQKLNYYLDGAHTIESMKNCATCQQKNHFNEK